MCMYVRMYACACMRAYSHVLMHVCMYVCMYAYMYVCMHICMFIYMYLWMYVCMYVCMWMCMMYDVCMYVCMHAHTCIHVVIDDRIMITFRALADSWNSHSLISTQSLAISCTFYICICTYIHVYTVTYIHSHTLISTKYTYLHALSHLQWIAVCNERGAAKNDLLKIITQHRLLVAFTMVTVMTWSLTIITIER